MSDSLQDRIQASIREEIAIVPYNPEWRIWFENEAKFLRRVLPKSLIIRVEHFGSTAIPGLAAKPIIDMLVEADSLDETRKQIVTILVSKGYDYFWRPPFNDASNPDDFYAWFIKRDSKGRRTHHLHMVEADSELWDRLYFRDYLREFPDVAKLYQELKLSLAERYPNDRIAYSEGKSEFIVPLTEKAKEYFNKLYNEKNK